MGRFISSQCPKFPLPTRANSSGFVVPPATVVRANIPEIAPNQEKPERRTSEVFSYQGLRRKTLRFSDRGQSHCPSPGTQLTEVPVLVVQHQVRQQDRSAAK